LSEGFPDTAAEEIEVAWGALLRDPDVHAFSLTAGNELRVTRSGRLERMDIELEEAFTRALMSAFTSSSTQEYFLPGGHCLSGARTSAGQIVLHVQKKSASEIGMASLLGKEFLTEAEALTLMQDLQAGRGLLIVGPHRVGRQLLLRAVASEAASFSRVMSPFHDASQYESVPDETATLEERIAQAYALGADSLIGSEMTLDSLKAYRKIHHGLPLVASLQCASEDVVRQELSEECAGIAFVTVGHQVGGAPVVYLSDGAVSDSSRDIEQPQRPIELQTPIEHGERAPMIGQGGPSMAAPVYDQSAPVVLGGHEDELPPLKPLGPGPPTGWGLESPSDPGWELDSNFAETLEAVAERPKFHPSPPPAHPQAHALQDKPFGGLTLEPPQELSVQPLSGDPEIPPESID
jgi:hypothetical protein